MPVNQLSLWRLILDSKLFFAKDSLVVFKDGYDQYVEGVFLPGYTQNCLFNLNFAILK